LGNPLFYKNLLKFSFFSAFMKGGVLIINYTLNALRPCAYMENPNFPFGKKIKN